MVHLIGRSMVGIKQNQDVVDGTFTNMRTGTYPGTKGD